MAEETQAHAQNAHKKKWIITGAAVVLIIAAAVGIIYFRIQAVRVYVDKATVQAPLINLSPSTPGILEDVYVNEGDTVDANATVARVGDQLIKAKVAGVIVSVPETIGAVVTSNQAVVTMIDPTQLRLVGEVDEDKGLSRIHVDDPIVFTADAFGSKEYTGVVDEVSPTSQQSQIVFNISDQREVNKFEVKARFDLNADSELKNGMSARMWIYTQ